MQIVNHQPRGSAATGEGTEHVRVGGGSRNSSFLRDSLHCANWIKRKNHSEALDEGPRQGDEHLELGQSNVVVVERAKKQNVLARKEVIGRQTTYGYVVGSVRKFIPVCWVVCEPVRAELGNLEGHGLSRRRCNYPVGHLLPVCNVDRELAFI